jgi:hypothetical protein
VAPGQKNSRQSIQEVSPCLQISQGDSSCIPAEIALHTATACSVVYSIEISFSRSRPAGLNGYMPVGKYASVVILISHGLYE